MKIDINLDDYPKLKDSENIESSLKYLLFIGYNQVYINEQSSLANNIVNKINNDLIKSGEKIDVIDEHIKKLFGLSTSSNKKGEISENIIYELIQNKFKDYSYEKKRHIAHNADGELNSPSGLKSLVEIKNYDNTVNKEEINKFKYDLQYNNIKFGLFISIKSNIINKKYFDYEIFTHNDNEYHLIYISKIYENENLLDSALILLEKLFEISNNNNHLIKSLHYSNLKSNFEDLNNLIEKTKLLNDKYLNLENIIKTSFNDFYKELREFDINLNKEIEKIWNNIQDNLDIKYLNKICNKQDILSKYKNDKCLVLFSRLFDILEDFDIIFNDNSIDIIKNKKIYGKIKKYKDKLNVDFNDSIKISINAKNLDFNLTILQKLIDSI